jgi:hypothetical protein
MPTVEMVVKKILSDHRQYLGDPPSETVRAALVGILAPLANGREISAHEANELAMVVGNQIGVLKRKGHESPGPAAVQELMLSFAKKAGIILDSSLAAAKDIFYADSGDHQNLIQDEMRYGQAAIMGKGKARDIDSAKEGLKKKVNKCLKEVPFHPELLAKFQTWLEEVWTFIDRGSDDRFGAPHGPTTETGSRSAIREAVSTKMGKISLATPAALKEQVRLLKEEEKAALPARAQHLKVLQIKACLKLYQVSAHSADEAASLGINLSTVGYGGRAAAEILDEARVIFNSIKPPYSREVVNAFAEAEVDLLCKDGGVSNAALVNAVFQLKSAERAKNLLASLLSEYSAGAPMSRTISMAAMRGDMVEKTKVDYQQLLNSVIQEFNNAGSSAYLGQIFTLNDVPLLWNNGKGTNNTAGLLAVLEDGLSRLNSADKAYELSQPWLVTFLSSEKVAALYDLQTFDSLLERWPKLTHGDNTSHSAIQASLAAALLAKAATPEQQARMPVGMINIILANQQLVLSQSTGSMQYPWVIDLVVKEFHATKPTQLEKRFNVLKFLEQHDPAKARILWQEISVAELLDFINQHKGTFQKESAAFINQLVVHAADIYTKLSQQADGVKAAALLTALHLVVKPQASLEAQALIEFLTACNAAQKDQPGDLLLNRFQAFVVAEERAGAFANKLEQRFIPARMSMDALIVLIRAAPQRILQEESAVQYGSEAVSAAEAERTSKAIASALAVFMAGNPDVALFKLGERLKDCRQILAQYSLLDNPVVSQALQAVTAGRYKKLKKIVSKDGFKLKTADILVAGIERREIALLFADEGIPGRAKQILGIAILLNPAVVERLDNVLLKDIVQEAMSLEGSEAGFNQLIDKLVSKQGILNSLKIWEVMPASENSVKARLAAVVATYESEPNAFDKAVRQRPDLILNWLQHLSANQVKQWAAVYLKTPDVAFTIFAGLEKPDLKEPPVLQQEIANHIYTHLFSDLNNLAHQYAVREKLHEPNKGLAAKKIAKAIRASNIGDLSIKQWLEIMSVVVPLAQKEPELLKKIVKELSTFPQTLANVYLQCPDEWRSQLVEYMFDENVVLPVRQDEVAKHILKSPKALEDLPVHRLKEIVDKLNGGLNAAFLGPHMLPGHALIDLRQDLKARFVEKNALVQGMDGDDILNYVQSVLRKKQGNEFAHFSSILHAPGNITAPYIAAELVSSARMIAQLSPDQIKILLVYANKIPADLVPKSLKKVDYAAIARKGMWVSGVSATQLKSAIAAENDPDARRALASKIVICLQEDKTVEPKVAADLMAVYFHQELPFEGAKALVEKAEFRKLAAEAVLDDLLTGNGMKRLLTDSKEAELVLGWVFENINSDKLMNTFSQQRLAHMSTEQQEALLPALALVRKVAIQGRGKILQEGRIVVGEDPVLLKDVEVIDKAINQLRLQQDVRVAEIAAAAAPPRKKGFWAWLFSLFSSSTTTPPPAPRKSSSFAAVNRVIPRAALQQSVSDRPVLSDRVSVHEAPAIPLVDQILAPLNARIEMLVKEVKDKDVWHDEKRSNLNYKPIHDDKLNGLLALRELIQANPRELIAHIKRVRENYPYIGYAGKAEDRDVKSMQSSSDSRTNNLLNDLIEKFGSKVASLPPMAVVVIDEKAVIRTEQDGKRAKQKDKINSRHKKDIKVSFQACHKFLTKEVQANLKEIREELNRMAKGEEKGVVAAAAEFLDDSIKVSHRDAADKKAIAENQPAFKEKLKAAQRQLETFAAELKLYTAASIDPNRVAGFIKMVEERQAKIAKVEAILIGDRNISVATREGAEVVLNRRMEPLRDYAAQASAASPSSIPTVMGSGIRAQTSATDTKSSDMHR